MTEASIQAHIQCSNITSNNYCLLSNIGENQQNILSNQSDYGAKVDSWIPLKRYKQKKFGNRGKENYTFNLNSKDLRLQESSAKKQQPTTQTNNPSSRLYDEFLSQQEMLYKQFERQMSQKAQNANQLLGFQYKDDDETYYKSIKSHSYYGKKTQRRRQFYNNNKPSSTVSSQSQMQFILKDLKDTEANLYDPNKIIEWKNVARVNQTLTNAHEVQCPICLGSLSEMIAPRISRCGHIFCWPCILKYLKFEKDSSFKRCPLCNDSIFRHELKSVQVTQQEVYQIGSSIKLNLMVRHKDTIILKKLNSENNEDNKIQQWNFPEEDNNDYNFSQILSLYKERYLNILQQDLKLLQEYLNLNESTQETHMIPFIQEAIEHCQKEISITSLESYSPNNEEAKLNHCKQIETQYHTFKPENSNNFHYFYQASTGEKIYLHPLSLKMLYNQFIDCTQLPLEIEAVIQDINYGVASQYDNDFIENCPYLNHLQEGASYRFVDIDLKSLISFEIYSSFQKELDLLEKQRNTKQLKEASYHEKVQKVHDQKFEQIKREAISASIHTNSIRQAPRQNPPQSIIIDQASPILSDITIRTAAIENQLWGNIDNLMQKQPQALKVINSMSDTKLVSGQNMQTSSRKQTPTDQLQGMEQENTLASSVFVTIEQKIKKQRKRK